MQESCTSQSWTAGFCGREGKESHPLYRMPIEQEDMQSLLFLINPLAKLFFFSRVLFQGSTNDLPGPLYLSGAHHHSHHAISSPSPQDIIFLLLFSLPLSLPSPFPNEPVFRFCAQFKGLPECPLPRARLRIVPSP